MKAIVRLQQRIRQFWQAEDGIGTVEMILILFVLIGVVIIFKANIESLVNDYFSKMDPGFTH